LVKISIFTEFNCHWRPSIWSKRLISNT